MSKLAIKTEKPASRCEICHQSNQFDPIMEFCYRCNEQLEEKDLIEYCENESINEEINYENGFTLQQARNRSLKVFATITALAIFASINKVTLQILFVTLIFAAAIILAKWAASLFQNNE